MNKRSHYLISGYVSFALLLCVGGLLLIPAKCEFFSERFFGKTNLTEIRQCLQDGNDVGIPDKYGWTPLHLAAKFKQPAVIEARLDAGADTKLKTSENKTAWDYAQENSRLKNTVAYWRLNESRFQ